MTDREEALRVPVETLRRFAETAFEALGVPEDDARICADVLLRADVRGIASHGVGRLKMYVDRIRAGMLDPAARPEIVREGPTTAVIDGRHGMGHAIGVRAMRLAIDKAKEAGLGAVAVRNSSHFGIAGYYALMAAEEDLIGLALTNARPSVFPTFGAEPMYGTNPIAFAAPTDEDGPFLFDASTSVVPRGKLEVLSRAGEPIPAGWVGDADGTAATETDAVLAGLNDGAYGLLPLGGLGEGTSGHKGYGLGILVEILCASLQAGTFLKDLASYAPDGTARKQQLGHFVLALDVAAFDEPAAFKRRTGEILRRLRAAKRIPGEDRIYTAGEKEREAEGRILARGVPIGARLQADLGAVRDALGIEEPKLPF